MNWIRENKFLAGFIAVVLIGAGALGYLLYTAWSTYSDASDEYTATASSLKQLQERVPYPDLGNLKKYRTQQEGLIAATGTLATSLSQMVLPVVEITPSAFQDRLREISNATAAKAARTGVKIPEHFALDFDQYQIQPPAAAAAGPLGRQLEALNLAVNILIDAHVDDITGLQRVRLAEETSAHPNQHGGSGGGGMKVGPHGPGGNNAADGSDLVEKIPFEIRFTSSQPAFQKVIDDFAGSSKQFFITRTLMLDNSNPKPISKASAEAATAATGAAAVAAGQPGFQVGPQVLASGTAGGNYLSFLVGTEKLLVTMQIDMVVFHPPEKAERHGGGH